MNININGLVENVLKKELIYEMDVVLEGGCMNGAYEIGGLLLLKELEKKNKIKIHRFSGVSVGSFISLLYLTNKLEYFTKNYKEWREMFNNTVKLSILNEVIKEICSEMTEECFKSLQINKLFITYYDTNEKRCIMKKEYISKKELEETILKSCHIPYLINGDFFYKSDDGEYLDGGIPYIFKVQENRKILYMKLTQYEKLPTIFNVGREINMDGRILEGVLDMYNFLMSKKATDMCSFVNNWGFVDMIRYNICSYIYWIGTHLVITFYKIIKIISPKLEKYHLYERLKPIGNEFYKEIIRYIVLT